MNMHASSAFSPFAPSPFTGGFVSSPANASATPMTQNGQPVLPLQPQPWFMAQQNGATPAQASQWVSQFNQAFSPQIAQQFPYGYYANPFGYSLNPGYGEGMFYNNGGFLPLAFSNSVFVNAFGWTPTFTGSSSTPIAANQHAAYWGDPHVADADRIDGDNQRSMQFNVTGSGFFQLLRDRTVTLNVEHRRYDQWAVDVVDKVGLNLAGATIVMTSEGKVSVGQYEMQAGEILSLRDGSVLEFTGRVLKVATPQGSGEYDLTFTLVDSGQWNNGKRLQYIDSDVKTRGQGVGSDGFLPTGILGEGFDPNSTARNGLQRDVADYRRPSLLEPVVSPNGMPFNTPQAFGPLPPKG
jgi:hypothetical protein